MIFEDNHVQGQRNRSLQPRYTYAIEPTRCQLFASPQDLEDVL